MIAKSWFGQCWSWTIGSYVGLVGALSLGVTEAVWAQIVPDNTLGAEGSVVTPNVDIRGTPSDRIDGGATRGANLFHSFAQFNVDAGRGAYFTNPAGVQNILSRVTGANRSEVLGRLGVLGNANLFLINPQGIVFGPAASLDVQGSFLATTADAVKLGDAGLFSAAQPATSSLLTVSPSALWFNAIATQPIVNQSQAASLISQPNLADLSPGLQVQPNRTLALVGGNVLLEGGRLTAAGGRIELGSVAGVGEVSLTSSGNRLALGYDAINDFGNISLSNGAFVDASGERGGGVQIRGARLEMTQSSNIWADLLGTQNGGDVLVRATEVVLSESSSLSAEVVLGTGTGGNLRIDTGRLLLRDGAYVSTSTYGEGKGGRLQITASESVELIGTSADGQSPSGLFTESRGIRGEEDAGDLTIDTERLLVRDGALVSASTYYGEGKGGRLQITTSESVEVIGTSADGEHRSGLAAVSQGIGDAGELRIDTGRLLVRDGAYVSTSTYGVGNGGRLQITTYDAVEVIGTTADGQSPSGLFTTNYGSGNAGELRIDTGRLLVSDEAQVSAATLGEDKGNGGNINIITTGSLSTTNGASLSTSTSGEGDAGDINIITGSLSLTNDAALIVSTSGEGDAGSINVSAEQLFLSSNAALRGEVGPNAEGQGGNINLNVTGTILLRGGITTPTPGVLWTGESTQMTIGVQPGGLGSGGTLNIKAGSLVLTDGAIIKNSTQGQGNAGNINVSADNVDISGSVPSSGLPSGLFTSTDTNASAGDIGIATRTLRIADGAALSARSKGNGQGGNIRVNATSFEAVNGGQLVTTTFGQGRAGNIFVNATDRVAIAGSEPNYTNRIAKFPNSISSYVANAITETGPTSGLFANTETNSIGNGGDIEVVTSNFNLTDSAQISASTSGNGRGGNLFVTAPQAVTISSNGKLSVETSGAGAGGNLTIGTQGLTIQDGAQVSASTSSPNPIGVGGNITVTATQSLDLNQASLLAESKGAAPAGSVTITTGNLTARNGTITTSSKQSSGGGITITADKMRLIGNSDITTRVNQGAGGGGDITLSANSILAFDDSDILSFAQDGSGGDITLKTLSFFGNSSPALSNTDPATLDDNNRVDANASGAVSGIITTPDTTLIQNSLSELPDNQINTDTLLANSCIVRRNQPTRGSFTIAGSGGFPQRPGDAQMSSFPTVDVATLPSESTSSTTNPNRSWQKGDPIVEPQGVYRLANGKLVLSRGCS